MNKVENKLTVEQVTEILKNYKELKKRALQLQFEIEHYEAKITSEDVIDTMTFGQKMGENVKGGQTSDKTSVIALSYVAKAEQLNIKDKFELEYSLRRVRTEMARIEFYIELLDVSEKDVMKVLYIENLTFVDGATKLGISLSTLKKLKIKGVKQITEMLIAVVE